MFQERIRGFRAVMCAVMPVGLMRCFDDAEEAQFSVEGNAELTRFRCV